MQNLTKSLRILLFALCTLAITQSSFAQSRNTEVQGKRWWYGGYFGLGFSGNQNLSVFSTGLSPMAGYKLTPFLSIGPRAIFDYTNYRVRDFAGDVISEGAIDYGLGAFLRGDIYAGVFAQAEMGYENIGLASLTGSGLNVARESGLNGYLGLGYNGRTGQTSFEVMLAYDLQMIDKGTLQPIDYRAGITIFY